MTVLGKGEFRGCALPVVVKIDASGYQNPLSHRENSPEAAEHWDGQIHGGGLVAGVPQSPHDLNGVGSNLEITENNSCLASLDNGGARPSCQMPENVECQVSVRHFRGGPVVVQGVRQDPATGDHWNEARNSPYAADGSQQSQGGLEEHEVGVDRAGVSQVRSVPGEEDVIHGVNQEEVPEDSQLGEDRLPLDSLLSKSEAREESQEWDGVSCRLQEGLFFTSRTAAKSFVALYSKSTLSHMVVASGGTKEDSKSTSVSYYSGVFCIYH